jgi:hypothetical protein
MSANKPTSYLMTLILVIIGLVWTVYSLQFLNQDIFWDLGIYEKAVTVFNAGGNPYDLNGYLSFVYHPLVLRFMALFGNSLGTVLSVAYIAIVLFFFKNLGTNRPWWLYSFLAFAYCGIGTISIGSGNVTVFFHLVLLGILLGDISMANRLGIHSSSSSKAFIIAVVIFSLVKPYMLAYLLIPLVCTFKSNKQKSTWALTLGAGAFLVLTLLLSSLYFGAEIQSFLNAVQGQTIGKHDLGYGLVMYFYEYYLSAGPLLYRAFVLHFAILGVLILAILFLAKRNGVITQPNFVLLLYFLLTILNPRLKVYDLFPALIALFIYASYFAQSVFIRVLFVIACSVSLSQMVGTPFFVQSGILSDPLNVYYLTMGLILLGLSPAFFSKSSRPVPRLKEQ